MFPMLYTSLDAYKYYIFLENLQLIMLLFLSNLLRNIVVAISILINRAIVLLQGN